MPSSDENTISDEKATSDEKIFTNEMTSSDEICNETYNSCPRINKSKWRRKLRRRWRRRTVVRNFLRKIKRRQKAAADESEGYIKSQVVEIALAKDEKNSRDENNSRDEILSSNGSSSSNSRCSELDTAINPGKMDNQIDHMLEMLREIRAGLMNHFKDSG